MSDREYLEEIASQLDTSIEEVCQEAGIKYEDILEELK